MGSFELGVRGDVGVGIQREPSRVVAQHRGHGLDVHAVLQGHRREGVAEIMKAYAGQSGPFQYSLQHMQDAVRGHGASGGRWEYPFAVTRFSSLLHQNVYRICRQWQGAIGVFCFQRGLDHFSVLPGNGPLNFQHTTVEVNVRPLQPQQFPTAQAGGQVDVVQGEHAAIPGLAEEGAELVGGQGFHLFVFDFWQGAALRWIFRDEVLLDSEVVRRADHLMDVSHGFRC